MRKINVALYRVIGLAITAMILTSIGVFTNASDWVIGGSALVGFLFGSFLEFCDKVDDMQR